MISLIVRSLPLNRRMTRRKPHDGPEAAVEGGARSDGRPTNERLDFRLRGVPDVISTPSGHDSATTSRSQHVTRRRVDEQRIDRKSTRLNSSHDQISYAVFCLKTKKWIRGGR